MVVGAERSSGETAEGASTGAASVELIDEVADGRGAVEVAGEGVAVVVAVAAAETETTAGTEEEVSVDS